MTRTPIQRSFVAWCAGGLLISSCASNPGPGGAAGGSGGRSVGSGGASAGMGGSSPNGGAAGGDPAAAGQSGGMPASGTGGASGGASGGAAEGGMQSVAQAGAGGVSGGGGAAASLPFDGQCGQGWAAGGSLPQLNGTVTPQVDGTGNWSFSFGRYRFVVAAAQGARVIEFSIDGNNLIDATGGSTFWPSPQQAYTWPPPAEIDSAAYAAQSAATSLTLTSEIATLTGGTASGAKLSVKKRFSVNAASGVVSIEYELTNRGTASASWAPWEVTRVPAGGYTFAPKGPGNRTISQDSFQNPLPLSLLPPAPAAGGIEWLNYPDIPKLTLDNYIGEFDGAEGWLAHANRFGKDSLPALLVKSFVDAADADLPTNQAEIQLWTSGTANPKLIEVEEQGALQELAPGAALNWTVHWSACKLADATLLSAGNLELAALARAHAVKP